MNDKVTSKEKYSYGGFFLGQNIIYALIAGFLMIYYTEVVSLKAVDVGIMFAIARLWDAINDPIMGIIIDKVKLKSGKFLPWIRTVTFLLPIIVIILFTNPFADAAYNIKLIYAYITYIAFGMVYTLSDVPIFAQSTVVSSDVNERTSYLMTGRFFALIGSLVAIVIFPLIATKIGLAPSAYLMAIIAFFTMLPFVFFGKERIHDKENSEKITVGKMIKVVFSNKYLLIYFTSFILLRGLMINQITGNYFYAFVMENTAIISIVALLSIIPGLLLAVVAPKLIRKLGKIKLYIILNLIGAVAGILLFFVGYNSTLVVIILATLMSFPITASSIMMGLFVGDCIEYGEYKTGHRNEALSFSVQTFTNKASTAITALIGGVALSAIGYVDASSVNDQVGHSLFTLTTIIPAVGVVISILVFAMFYKLTESKVKDMIKANNEKK